MKISNGRVNCKILDSKELTTEFTISAEEQTEALGGFSINTEITRMQQSLRCEPWAVNNRQILEMVYQINRRAMTPDPMSSLFWARSASEIPTIWNWKMTLLPLAIICTAPETLSGIVFAESNKIFYLWDKKYIFNYNNLKYNKSEI